MTGDSANPRHNPHRKAIVDIAHAFERSLMLSPALAIAERALYRAMQSNKAAITAWGKSNPSRNLALVFDAGPKLDMA